MEFLVLDQTRPGIGMPVERVIVPGMRYFWARFALGCFYEVPVSMGRRQHALAESDPGCGLKFADGHQGGGHPCARPCRRRGPHPGGPAGAPLEPDRSGPDRRPGMGAHPRTGPATSDHHGALPFGLELPLHTRNPAADFGASLASGTRMSAFFRELGTDGKGRIRPRQRSCGYARRWTEETRPCVRSSSGS